MIYIYYNVVSTVLRTNRKYWYISKHVPDSNGALPSCVD